MGCTRLFYTTPITLRGQAWLRGPTFALPTPYFLFFTVCVVLKGTILLDNMFSVSEEQWRLYCSAGVHVRSRGNGWRQWKGVPTVLPIAKSVIRPIASLRVSAPPYHNPPKKGKNWNHTPEGPQTFSFLFNLGIITSTCPQQKGLLQKNNS